MKYYNENKTEMLDLTKVSQFTYDNNVLNLVCDGHMQWIYAPRAELIYRALMELDDSYNKSTSKKQLLTENTKKSK